MAQLNFYRLYTMNQDQDPIDVADFATEVEATNAANAAAGEELEWHDTQLGAEAYRDADALAVAENGEYPAVFWQIVGIDEDGVDADMGWQVDLDDPTYMPVQQ